MPEHPSIAIAKQLLGEASATTVGEYDLRLQTIAARLGVTNLQVSATGVLSGVTTLDFPLDAADILAGILAVARGGTGLASGTSGGILGYTAVGTLASSIVLTANAVVLGGGAGATPTPLGSLGTTTTVLHGNAAGAPTFGTVSLTADISGILPIANGGTNATSFTSTRVPFFDGTRFVDDADLTFATDTLSATKLLSSTSISTPSLISTAAVGIIPAAGSNLNVTLSTTGDFVVNIDDLYVDTSTGFIGVGTVAPDFILDIQGAVDLGGIRLAATTTNRPALRFANVTTGDLAQFYGTNAKGFEIDVNAGATLGLAIDSAGNMGVGYATPATKLNVSGAVAIGVNASNGYQLEVQGGSDLAAMNVVATTTNRPAIRLSNATTGELARLVGLDGKHCQIWTNSALTVVATFFASGNVGIGTETAPTTGSMGLVFGDGTALSGLATNTAGLYANDVAGTVEMFAIDEAAGATQISPHNFSLFTPNDAEPYPWDYYSENSYLGERINVNMMGIARWVEQQSGQSLIHRQVMPRSARSSWVTDQEIQMRRAMTVYEVWESGSSDQPAPPVPVVKRPRVWMQRRLEATGNWDANRMNQLFVILEQWKVRRSL